MNQTENNTVNQQAFPDGFFELFLDAKIENVNEGLIVLLHTFLLEVGFVSKDVVQCDVYKRMPENWKSSGSYKIRYHHKEIQDAFCWLTCVPLYSNLAIHGTLEENQPQDSRVYLNLKVNSFVNTDRDLTDPSSLFIHPDELSRLFKDEFWFPLLVLLQESVDYKPSFGLSGLDDELKFSILNLLPVESVVALSAVNKNFHRLTNSSYLWKSLFIRDYDPGYLDSFDSSDENWKEIYKEQYLRARRPLPMYNPYGPEIFPMRPNYDIDYRIDMDPALQQAFPLMRSRFLPSSWWLPGSGYSFYRGFWQ